MQRAGPFANTVFPTREAAGGLLLRLRRGERLIDLLKVALTRLRRQLIRLPARRRHRHLPDLRANIGLAAGQRTALPRLHLLACRAQSPLLRQRGQRFIVGEGQCLRGTVFHTGRSRLAALAQIAFQRAGLYQARSLRRHHHLHHPERAGHHAGFTANAFLLTDLNAVAGLGNGVVGATADAGASSQWRQVIALRWPAALMTVIRGKKRCGVSTCCSSLCAITQATSQAWQPIHFRLSLKIKWFMASFCLLGE